SDSEAAQDSGNLSLAGVNALARLGAPLKAGDRRFSGISVLQPDGQRSALSFPFGRRAGDVPFRGQDLGDAFLERRARQDHVVLPGHAGIADPGEEVGDGIGHDHVLITSPRRLGHAGHLALMRELPETYAAQGEAPEYGARPPAAGTSRVGPDPELPASPLLLLRSEEHTSELQSRF